MNLQERTILLTGAARIGQTVAEELAHRGANLAVAYRTSQTIALETCSTCIKCGTRAVPFQADLSDEVQINLLVEQVLKEFGHIDGLVHMAANYPRTPVDELSMAIFVDTMKTIAGSSILLGSRVAMQMHHNPGQDILVKGEVVGKIRGKIIFFSDWSVLRSPYPDYSVYNCAKAAVNSITATFARAYAPDITVNAIAPGPILRPPNLNEAENREALRNTPLGRWGGPESIAQAVAYLLEDDFTTGVILPVDGGRSIG